MSAGYVLVRCSIDKVNDPFAAHKISNTLLNGPNGSVGKEINGNSIL
jgi:hypothetical protein